MDKTTRYLKTALAVLVTLACLYTVGLLRGFLQDVWHVVYVVLLPFLISVVICYILQPVVELLVRRRVPRGMAILLIYIVFILALVVAVLQAIPAVTRQFTQLADHVPTLLQQANGWLDGLSRHTKYLPDAARQGIETSLARLEQSVAGFIAGMFSMLSNTLNALFVAFVIPFIVFYMLKDADAIGRGVLVKALTTMIGFGTLMIASERGLVGLGLILTLGVGCSMLTALIFLPAVLHLWSAHRPVPMPSVSPSLAENPALRSAA